MLCMPLYNSVQDFYTGLQRTSLVRRWLLRGQIPECIIIYIYIGNLRPAEGNVCYIAFQLHVARLSTCEPIYILL